MRILKQWEFLTKEKDAIVGTIADDIAREVNESGLKTNIDKTVKDALSKLKKGYSSLSSNERGALRRAFAVCYNNRANVFQQHRSPGTLDESLSSGYVSYDADVEKALVQCWKGIRGFAEKQRADTPDEVTKLARRLLNCSPRTRPYSGKAEPTLVQELGKETDDRPVLRAVLISLLLDQWRKGAITPADGDSHKN